MAEILYLADRLPGVHVYHPELGERKPETKMKASLSHYGKHYFVDTPYELKGRGIVPQEVHWHPGSVYEREGWKSYRVTVKAFEKLEKEYSISMAAYLD